MLWNTCQVAAGFVQVNWVFSVRKREHGSLFFAPILGALLEVQVPCDLVAVSVAKRNWMRATDCGKEA